jgi:multisubunit Na+/H+ antiporter MnhF subunit
MAKVTLVFAFLLVALGLAGYYYTGHTHPTALIPMWFGIALGICGFLAISPNETRRKIFIHIAVVIGVLGFFGGAITAIQGYGSARSHGVDPDMVALWDKVIMAFLMLNYTVLCVQSFIKARRSREEA